MHPVVRSILAVLAGIVVALALVAAIEAGGHAAYPVPAGVDLTSPEQARAYMDGIPLGALLFVFAAWTCGAFGGALVAALLAKSRPMSHAGIVGGVVLAAAAANLAMLPHPTWFAVLGVAGIVVGAFAAGKLVSLRAALREGAPEQGS
jgi:hypothetical protein